MSRRHWSLRFLAILFGFSLLAAACGGDDDDAAGGDDTADGGGSAGAGGEFVDLGTFGGGTPEHIDPALNVELDSFQITNALYDGLTEIDFSDPDDPELKGLVAESWTPNADATEFVFTIKDGVKFSNGEPVLPSSFQLAWERATDPAFAGQYAYLAEFLDGGKEKLCLNAPAEKASCEGVTGAETITGVTADDEAMTLTTKLDKPYANWPTVAGFQLFYPMPKAVEELDDQNDWENGLMIGNGPYKLAEARTDEEIVLEKNEAWSGDFDGEVWPDRLDTITFISGKDVDTSYNAFEAGEGDNAVVPPSRWGQAKEDHQNTIRQALGTRYFELKWDDPVVGGPENVKLREAMLLSVDRDQISEAIYNGTNPVATSMIPPGVPGFTKDICKFCKYDPEAAKAAFAEWEAAGNSLAEPIRVQFNIDHGHEDVVNILVDNFNAVGIDAELEPMDHETYFTKLGEGACQVCRSGWYADYPTADNFTFDLFSTSAIGGNNHGFYQSPEFDDLIAQAKATVDVDAANALYAQAEDVLLNQDVAVLPYLYYALDYVYGEDVLEFPVTPLGLILWEQVTKKA